MKKVLIFANFYFAIPFLFIYVFMNNGQLHYIEFGIIIMLVSLLVIMGVHGIEKNFTENTFFQTHKYFFTIIEVFENIFYVMFFLGLLYTMNIGLIPIIGR